MGVSKNRGTPKSSILIGVFHYKPGYPYFLETPIYTLYYLPLFRVRTKMRNEVISLSSWLLFLVRGIYLTENPKKWQWQGHLPGPHQKLQNPGFWPTQNFSPSGSRCALKLCLWAKLWFLTRGANQLTGSISEKWSFLLPLIGGRWYIIPQLAIYKPYTYCQLGDSMLPTTYKGNQRINHWSVYFMKNGIFRKGTQWSQWSDKKFLRVWGDLGTKNSTTWSRCITVVAHQTTTWTKANHFAISYPWSWYVTLTLGVPITT